MPEWDGGDAVMIVQVHLPLTLVWVGSVCVPMSECYSFWTSSAK